MGRTRLFIGVGILAAAILTAIFTWRALSLHGLKDQALRLASQGDFAQAEPLLRQCMERSPNDVEILAALAKGYFAADRKSSADECVTRWLDNAPTDSEALLLRIDLYRELGQLEKAVRDTSRLIAIDSTNLAWRRKRLRVLFDACRFAEAEKECQLCLQTKPGDASLLRFLAEVKKARGQFEEAGSILDDLLRVSPQDSSTLMARALLYYHQDESDKSIPLFREVIKLDRNRQRAGRYHLALALNRVGQSAEADRLMEEVRRMQDAEILRDDSSGQPKNLPLQMRTARAQFENNDLARAVKILQHVLTIDADYAPAHALLADVYDQQGRFDLAVEHRRRAKEKR